MQNVTRRNFMAATGIALAGTAAVASTSAAVADEAAAPEYDAIVVGAGIAGVSTGIHLLECGVERVAIVTKGGGVGAGANSTVAGGQFLYPMTDDEEGVELFFQSFMRKSQGLGREDLTRLISENAKAANEWLIGHGCEFTEPVQVKPFDVLAVNAAPGAGVGMPPLMEQLGNEYAALGGELIENTKLIDFVLDDMGAVCGVKVRNAEKGVYTIAAKATVVATGGYLANKQVMEQWCGADGDQILVRGQKTLTGDGLLAAERIGGMQYTMGGIQQSLHIAPVPPQAPALCPFASAQYTIAVNKAGERFCDEAGGYVTIGKAAYEQPGQTHALIFDQAAVDSIEVLAGDVQKFANFEIPVATADTIEELAEQLEMDPAVLKATVDEFNAASDGEKTTGLAIEKTAVANKIETAPFYAFFPMVPGGTQCFGGLYTDGDCRVLESDGTVIPNLYAAGEVIGGIFVYDYIGGASLTRGVVSGMHVAELIAQA